MLSQHQAPALTSTGQPLEPPEEGSDTPKPTAPRHSQRDPPRPPAHRCHTPPSHVWAALPQPQDGGEAAGCARFH